MKSPEISIILSAYNSSKHLAESIEGMLNQTFDSYEFIIIDDGSQDSTFKIMEGYKERDSRIKLIKNDKNLGLTKSLNIGLLNASGRYIARQDAGDISLPNRLKTQYKYLEDNPEIFLVGTSVINIDEHGRTINISKAITKESRLERMLLKQNAIFHSTIMFRNTKKIFYREKFKFSQDYDLYLCLLSAKKRIINIPQVLLKYRLSPTAISYTNRIQQTLFAKKALEFFKQRRMYGRDEYEVFDPQEITNLSKFWGHACCSSIESGTGMSPEYIKAYFEINNFRKVRELYPGYFRNKKLPDRYLIYYLASFLPKWFINLLRRLL